MLVKTSIAAALLVALATPLWQIDYRALYNGMYPVNGLKRDVLGLCHDTKPTFIRALRSDRVTCYDSMPDAVDLAIGWVRTSDRLAALKHTPTAVDLAEKVLAEAVIRGRLGMPEGRRFTGYLAEPVAARPCQPTALAPQPGSLDFALGESDERLARHILKGGDAALAALGLLPRRDPLDKSQPGELRIVPLRGSTPAAAPHAGSGTPAADCGTPA